MSFCVSLAICVSLSDSEHQKMLFSLEQCEFSFAKTQMIMDMNQLELKRYKKINADIGELYIIIIISIYYVFNLMSLFKSKV